MSWLFGKSDPEKDKYKVLLRLDDEFTSVANDNYLSDSEKKSRYHGTLSKLENLQTFQDSGKENHRKELIRILRSRI